MIPSFVVTLAGLLAWQGAQLRALGSTGTVNLRDPAITNIAGVFLAEWLGWAVGIGSVAVIAGLSIATRARRARTGLELEPMLNMVLRIGASAVAILAAVAVVNSDRGVALAFLILVGLVVAVHLLTTKTAFGRHIYAVGGNAEAARRAGIRVQWVRTGVFMLASTLAAWGGIVAASRLLAVNQSSGGSDLLLLSIAGPVVAGVSLFGGRGRGLGGAARRARDRVDLQRHGPAGPAVVGEVHGHGRRPAGGGLARRHRAPAPRAARGRVGVSAPG